MNIDLSDFNRTVAQQLLDHVDIRATFDKDCRKRMAQLMDGIGVRLENGIYGHSRFCNTDFDDKLACLNLSGV